MIDVRPYIEHTKFDNCPTSHQQDAQDEAAAAAAAVASMGGGRGGRSSTDDDSDEDEGEGGDGNHASQSDWVALTYNLVVSAFSYCV